MNRRNCLPDQPTIVPTHKVDISLPANTKYVSGNPVSRLLIRGFMRALVDFASRTHPRTVLDVGCGEGLVLRQLETMWDRTEIHGLDIDEELLHVDQKITSNDSY